MKHHQGRSTPGPLPMADVEMRLVAALLRPGPRGDRIAQRLAVDIDRLSSMQPGGRTIAPVADGC